MGNVGISFGSPTSGQGFDVSTTVSQIVANLQAIETPWKNQLSSLQSQDTALSSISTDLSSLSTALESLTDFEGVLSEKEGSSSDTSVLEITNASSTAVAGSHTVVVTQLATTDSQYSGDLGAADSLTGSLIINGKTITISDGSTQDGNGHTIPANDTVSTLASYINSGNYGVTAEVYPDGASSRLALVSNTGGAGGNIAIDSSNLTNTTTGNGITFTDSEKNGAQDAIFSVDGIPRTSPTNTVTTGIPGITFQLLSQAPNESVQVEITNDNSAVESAVGSFVSAYNTVMKDLNSQEGNDASGNAEPLYGNPTTALLQEQLQSALNFAQSSGAITSLTQLGITASASDDGTLTLNSSALDAVLNSNYQDVINFFQPSGAFKSFGGNLSSVLNNLSNTAPFGAIYLALQQNSSAESQLNTSITNENATISAEQSQLTTELNEANYTLQSIPSQLQEVNEMYSAITGYNENSNG